MSDAHPFENLLEQHKLKQDSTVTVKKAAQELKLTEGTIYNYVRAGILETANSLSSEQIKITTQSIELLKNKGNTVKDKGISLNAFAKSMNITKSRLSQIIKEYNIIIPKVLHGQREQYLITEELQQVIHDILREKEHFPKTPFFHSRRNIALYQAFTSTINQNVYRIEREGNIWGIRVPTGILPFEIAEARYKLIANYNLRQRIRTSTTSVTIRIPLQHEQFYAFIDTIYATFGLDNLQFQYEEDHSLLIIVKTSNYKLRTPAENVQQLEPFLINGTIDIVLSTIKLRSLDSTFTIVISQSHMSKLEQLAKESNLTTKEWIDRIVKEHLINTH